MNFKKLENNLLDMIQEQQVKIGYMSEFLVRFINTVARHGCTLDEVMNVFHSYSKHVHMEKTTGTGFDYLVYFEDGIPDDYRYCLSLEGEHMIYHKFTPEDYEDFGF